ncbi:hypothetical protein [Nocardioides montaniterrae]
MTGSPPPPSDDARPQPTPTYGDQPYSAYAPPAEAKYPPVRRRHRARLAGLAVAVVYLVVKGAALIGIAHWAAGNR